MRRLGFLCWLILLAGPLASAASAAFPGRNGLLAVQPLSGPGIELVDVHGAHEQLICVARALCGAPQAPRWSPDGRAIAFDSPGVELIYADGSCLNCSGAPGRRPAFTADPTLLTSVSAGRLSQYGVDGIPQAPVVVNGVAQPAILARRVSDAVWSASGRLAIVRSGHVWAGSPAHLQPLGAGHAPSWSPNGSRIAFARGAWVMTDRLGARHHPRRLVLGGGPAWSPDGRSIAFVDPGHELRVIAPGGGRARRIGRVRAVSVDWQPLPRTPPAACDAPPGSQVAASAPGSVITSDSGLGSTAFMGCLTADGRERLLESFGPGTEDSLSGVSAAAVAGDYAAFIVSTTDPHYGGQNLIVSVDDLRTAAQVPDRGGESVSCPDYSGYNCFAVMDQLVLNSEGFSAVHTQSNAQTNAVEEIIASDGGGVRTLETVTDPSFEDTSLSGLSLTGDTLSWEHAGTPESAQLN